MKMIKTEERFASYLGSIEEFTSFHVNKAKIAIYKTQQDVNTTREDLGRRRKTKLTPLWNSIIIISVNLKSQAKER